jgi:hypothetical protein
MGSEFYKRVVIGIIMFAIISLITYTWTTPKLDHHVDVDETW